MREKLASDILLVGHRVYALDDVTDAAAAIADALISIGDPGDPVPYEVSLSKKRYLALNFYDFEHEHPDAPQESHVRDLLEFAARTLPTERLLVHCYAGISRSTAALAIVLASIHPELDHDMVFDTVWRIRPEAWPNARLIAQADRLMNCGGEFSAALERFRERVSENT